MTVRYPMVEVAPTASEPRVERFPQFENIERSVLEMERMVNWAAVYDFDEQPGSEAFSGYEAYTLDIFGLSGLIRDVRADGVYEKLTIDTALLFTEFQEQLSHPSVSKVEFDF